MIRTAVIRHPGKLVYLAALLFGWSLFFMIR